MGTLAKVQVRLMIDAGLLTIQHFFHRSLNILDTIISGTNTIMSTHSEGFINGD